MEGLLVGHGQKLPIEHRPHRGGEHLRHGEGEPEPVQAEAGEQKAQGDEEHHRADDGQQRAFQAEADGLEEHGEQQGQHLGQKADPYKSKAHFGNVCHQGGRG